MKVEMDASKKNSTWKIINKPKEENIVDCKWKCTTKYTVDGIDSRDALELME